jgi:glycosyltransferase involved in cell wall biosynthesis
MLETYGRPKDRRGASFDEWKHPMIGDIEAKRIRVVMLGYVFDRDDVGESFVAYKWALHLSELVDLTVLAFERTGQVPLKEQLPNARVITWPEPRFFTRWERLNAMMKPSWFFLRSKVKAWVNAELASGEKYDLFHQVAPFSLRYPSPFRNFEVPYILGPVGGSLKVPKELETEVKSDSWFTKLRKFDQFRLRHDSRLRASFAKASCVIGVAPYVETILKEASLPVRRFEALSEWGVDSVVDAPAQSKNGKSLKLLHVGRVVRTKGLRDVVRAMALLKDYPDIQLTSAGHGNDIDECKREAQALGVAERVIFLGRVSRQRVEQLYEESDILVFPSFRESSGGVVIEAMRWGLPIITCNYGGPANVVDNSTGILIEPSDPEQFHVSIATAIKSLRDHPELISQLGGAAITKIERNFGWDRKLQLVTQIYRSCIGRFMAIDV